MPPFSEESIREFLELVAKMRNYQRAYIASRGMVDLEMAKNAERQVDGWLNHFYDLRQADDLHSAPKQIPLL